MNYLKAQATTNKLLKKFGQTVTLTTQVQGAYNVATGKVSVSQDEQTTIGAVFDWGTSTSPSYGADWNGSGLVQANDRQLMLSPVGITAPNLGDMAIIGDTQYTIVAPIKIEAPAGIPVVIICGIRGI